MRNLFAVVLIAFAALVAGPVLAADLPDYAPPVISVPDVPVDSGLGGSFYLRGSVGGNLLWAHDVFNPGCGCGGTTTIPNTPGYGYSFGAGIGYEVGNGLRADVTADYLDNSGLSDGTSSLRLRTGLLLANAYYDFGLGGDNGSAAGGFGAYVGAGVGGAYNSTVVTSSIATPDGNSYTAAAALMAGVTYDMGSVVADLGYRAIYMPTISNGTPSPFYVNQNLVHEVRGTLRYRFN
jgi:opacity protein-like surface antigen